MRLSDTLEQIAEQSRQNSFPLRALFIHAGRVRRVGTRRGRGTRRRHPLRAWWAKLQKSISPTRLTGTDRWGQEPQCRAIREMTAVE
jgi:hypothetical protein